MAIVELWRYSFENTTRTEDMEKEGECDRQLADSTRARTNGHGLGT